MRLFLVGRKRGGAMVERTVESAPDGVAEHPPEAKKPKPDDSVWAILGFRNAGDQVARFAKSTRSLGLASWCFGISFAAAAVGLRFWSAADMTASEFVSTIVFAALLVVGGYCMYVLESRGYVRLVSEIVTRAKGNGQAHGELPAGGSHGDGAAAAPANVT
jgi:hypothetical protein